MSLLRGIMSRCFRSHQSLGIRVTGSVMNENSPQQHKKPLIYSACSMMVVRPFGHKSYGRKTPKLEKRRKKLESEPYLIALRHRLATDHGIILTTPLHGSQKKVPLAEKWAKRGWKCALACHKLEQGEDCTELMKDQQFAQRAEEQSLQAATAAKTKYTMKEKNADGVLFTAAEKRRQRGALEQSQAKVHLQWITKALKARGESTEGTMGELQTRLQVSVLGQDEHAKCDEMNRIKMEELSSIITRSQETEE